MSCILQRIKGILCRGILKLSDDVPKMRVIQAEFLPGDIRDGLEHFEPYGFTSKAHEGAEVFGAFFNGDRSHGVVLATADRRYRLKMEKGEVAIYDDLGQFVHLRRNGISVNTPGNLDIKVGGVTVLNSGGAVTVKAPSVTIDAPATTCTGTLTVKGLITGQGGLNISGGGSGAAAVITGTLTTTGDVVAGDISLTGHVHGGVQGGTSKTSGPE